jgi:hypothetical protein
MRDARIVIGYRNAKIALMFPLHQKPNFHMKAMIVMTRINCFTAKDVMIVEKVIFFLIVKIVLIVLDV